MSCRGGLAAAAGFFFLLALMASSTGPGRAGPGLLSSLLLLLVLAWLSGPVGAVSERGKWILDIDNVSYLLVSATRPDALDVLSVPEAFNEQFPTLTRLERRVRELQLCFNVV